MLRYSLYEIFTYVTLLCFFVFACCYVSHIINGFCLRVIMFHILLMGFVCMLFCFTYYQWVLLACYHVSHIINGFCLRVIMFHILLMGFVSCCYVSQIINGFCLHVVMFHLLSMDFVPVAH